MHVLIARYTVKEGEMPAVLRALGEMAIAVSAYEPACTSYTVARTVDDDSVLVLIEHYVDEAAILAHRETSHFREHIEGDVVPRLDKREREVLEVAL